MEQIVFRHNLRASPGRRNQDERSTDRRGQRKCPYRLVPGGGRVARHPGPYVLAPPAARKTVGSPVSPT